MSCCSEVEGLRICRVSSESRSSVYAFFVGSFGRGGKDGRKERSSHFSPSLPCLPLCFLRRSTLLDRGSEAHTDLVLSRCALAGTKSSEELRIVLESLDEPNRGPSTEVSSRPFLPFLSLPFPSPPSPLPARLSTQTDSLSFLHFRRCYSQEAQDQVKGSRGRGRGTRS